MKIKAEQLKKGQQFKSPSYPGLGIRTCQSVHVREVGWMKTVIIDCGVGISSVELILGAEVEIIGDEPL